MASGDLVFYILDVIILCMIGYWWKNTKSIVIRTKIGARWLVPSLFLVVAAIGFFRYEGYFKYIQTAALIVIAFMYYQLGSGLSEEGVVMQGALTKWKDAGTITVNKKESCIIFTLRKRTASLYFEADQLKDIRAFLAKKSVNHQND